MKVALLLLGISAVIAFTGLAPHWSILLGMSFAFAVPISEAIQKNAKILSSRLLQVSVVLLGANLNFQSILKNGSAGVLVTFTSITLVFILGLTLARFIKVASPLSELICAGTSICGGSAIAALSPVLQTQSAIMAAALGIVFILNAASVFIFPPIGHFLNMTQEQFGTWAALAIHDTSSVVAASQIYGETALKVGVTLKLTRALWIIPLTLIFSLYKKSKTKITFPWFIALFLLVSLLFSMFHELNFMADDISRISKAGLSVTLFLIGLSLNMQQLRVIGLRPIIFGTVLWLVTALGSLLYTLA